MKKRTVAQDIDELVKELAAMKTPKDEGFDAVIDALNGDLPYKHERGEYRENAKVMAKAVAKWLVENRTEILKPKKVNKNANH